MCGIWFSLSTTGFAYPSEETSRLIRQRGPDSYRVHTVTAQSQNAVYLTFASAVLSLRGEHLHAQPLVDEASGSVLCWNGEAWAVSGERVQGNDTEVILQLFLQAVRADTDADTSVQRLTEAVSEVSGPFAFVFYDALHGRVFFSRDCLGRRSLLRGGHGDGDGMTVCSLWDGASSEEVDTQGVYVVDLVDITSVRMISWADLKTPIPAMNTAIPDTPRIMTPESPVIHELQHRLSQSLEPRLANIPNGVLGVLFSGGLDCTLLARLSHDILPLSYSIDLLNVAFENPRVATAAAAASTKKAQGATTGCQEVYEACPDRITARAALKELQTTCPSRHWRLVAINIPYAETLAHREHIKRLMRPHNTEMDLSIACALYFAARGTGTGTDAAALYTTPSKILLSGLGADELFSGYNRHAIAFQSNSYKGLITETALDVSRLGARNLGRDDRVLSTWGREVRYPFLDEGVVAWVVSLPIWEKCGFQPPAPVSTSIPDSPGIEAGTGTGLGLGPEKLALRLVAHNLGLENVAKEKKRAIQFGARTAKMEKGRTRGTDSLA